MLKSFIYALVAWLFGASCWAADPVYNASGSLPVLEPVLERRTINVPKIDTEKFEVGIFVGVLSVEDFGSSMLRGMRVDVHATEDFFIEGSYGQASVSDESFRSAGIAAFGSSGQQFLDYYNVVLGYNLFPGQIFWSTSRAWTSAAYLVAGAGNSNIANDDYFSIVFGMGIRAQPTDWLSLRVEARGHEMETNLLGRRKMAHNFEANFSVGVFF